MMELFFISVIAQKVPSVLQRKILLNIKPNSRISKNVGIFLISLGLETWINTYHCQRKHYSDQLDDVSLLEIVNVINN